MKLFSKYLKSALFLGLISVLFSCNEEVDTPPSADPSSDVAVNRWIKDVMDEVYFWLADMKTPISEDSAPEDYFESLLNRPTDRFSAIYPNYDELLNNLGGVSLDAGYEFNLFLESQGSENIIAEISYVKKNSPAQEAGLVRGDIITEINDTRITIQNYLDLLSVIDQTHTLNYRSFDEGLGAYLDQEALTLNPIVFSENPNFLDSIYTIENEKIGYAVYHFFTPGPNLNSDIYDNQMDQIFERFKLEGINHLIIDFRYNTGGFVSSAINLASLIAPNIDDQDVFSKTKYNDFLMQFEELQNIQSTFLTKSQNLGQSLTGNRIYILTSSRTASASELVINGLRPYMDVFIIGDKTVGKNVGSIPFEDEENPENLYGILPIVTQSSNSLDQSDYSNGFIPNIEALERTERLQAFGNIDELLLRTAIQEITGTPSGSRLQKLDRIDFASTLDKKIRTGRMIESPNKDILHSVQKINNPFK